MPAVSWSLAPEPQVEKKIQPHPPLLKASSPVSPMVPTQEALKAKVTKLPKYAKGAIYSKYYSFVMDPPEGWVLDKDSGSLEGLKMVFYPKGTTWQTATTVMYINIVHKRGLKHKENKTFSQIMADDAVHFKTSSPNIKVETAEPIPTQDGKTAEVQVFREDKYGNIESVAYIDEPQVVVVVVMSSRKEAAYQKHVASFNQWVASYRSLSDSQTQLARQRRMKSEKASASHNTDGRSKHQVWQPFR